MLIENVNEKNEKREIVQYQTTRIETRTIDWSRLDKEGKKNNDEKGKSKIVTWNPKKRCTYHTLMIMVCSHNLAIEMLELTK